LPAAKGIPVECQCRDKDLIRRVDRIFVAPDDARLVPGSPEYSAFMRHIDEHPLIAHNARIVDPVPRKISDFLSGVNRTAASTLYIRFKRRWPSDETPTE
jgi:hypothetical protein